MEDYEIKLTKNYHTHTKRCGHALGEDEDFVSGALEIGITELGFSDHVPLKGLTFPRMRQDYEAFDDYKNSIENLQKKYADKIKLHLGYEAEYVPQFLPQYEEMLNCGVEYFICGNHCFIDDGKQVFYNSFYHSEEMVEMYVDGVISAMESRMFKYVAHPDLFMNGYRLWDDFAVKESRRLFAAAEKYCVPLEINGAGIRFAEYKHRTNAQGLPIENLYPYSPFWELASQYDVKGIIGIDAHRKEDFLDGTEKEAVSFAQKHKIKLVTDIFNK